MPYRDRESSRAYQRDYKRLRRSGSAQTPVQVALPLDFRLQTARDVLDLLAEQIAAVRAEPSAGTLEKARVIGFLSGPAMKAIEVADLAGRLEAIESVLKHRKDGNQ